MYLDHSSSIIINIMCVEQKKNLILTLDQKG